MKPMRVVMFLILLVVLACAVVFIRGYSIANTRLARQAPDFVAQLDSSQVARGEHLAAVVCAGCHSVDAALPLSGGSANLLATRGGAGYGTLVAPNLTPGGVLPKYTRDAELVRAIREAIGADGRPLLLMPTTGYQNLSRTDLAAVVAYLRRQPAVEHATPARQLTWQAYWALGTGRLQPNVQKWVEHESPGMAEEPTPEFGQYTATVLACTSCHGADLRGGRAGNVAPVGPDLVALAASHPIADFDHAIRGGVGTSGRTLHHEAMPWFAFHKLDDTEVAALYALLKSKS